MCFGGSTTSTVQTQANLPSWYSNAMQDVITRASQTSNNPFPAGGLAQVAGLNPLQMGAIQGVNDVQGQWSPLLNLASALGGRASMTWPEANVGAYMNPYIQNVIDIQKQQAQVDYDRARQGRDATAISRGAFGGTRQALDEIYAQQGLMGQLGNIQAQGMNTAFNNAQNAWQSDQDRALRNISSLAELAKTGQGLNFADLDALSKAGAQMQGQAQREYDTSTQNALTLATWPQQQQKFLASIIQGTPTGIFGSTQTSTAPGPNPLAQGLGLGANILGILGGADVAGGSSVLAKILGYNKGGRVKGFKRGGAVKTAFADGGGIFGAQGNDLSSMPDDAFWRGLAYVQPTDSDYSAWMEEANKRRGGQKIQSPTWKDLGPRPYPSLGGSKSYGGPYTSDFNLIGTVLPALSGAPTKPYQPTGIFKDESLSRFSDREGAFNPPSSPVQDMAKGFKIPTRYGAIVNEAATKHGVRPELLAKVFKWESNWNPDAYGDKGQARGLGQMHRGAAQDVGYKWEDLNTPDKQADASAAYLAKMLKAANGDEVEALRMYNAGVAGARRNPNAGKQYAAGVLAQGEPTASPVLDAAPEIKQALAKEGIKLPEPPKPTPVNENEIKMGDKASKWNSSPWAALAAAGTAMMQSKSPNFMSALGEGFGAAQSTLKEQAETGRKEKLLKTQLEQRDFDNRMKQADFQLSQQKAENESRYNEARLKLADAQMNLDRSNAASLDNYRRSEAEYNRRRIEAFGTKEEREKAAAEDRDRNRFKSLFETNSRLISNNPSNMGLNEDQIAVKAGRMSVSAEPTNPAALEFTRGQFAARMPDKYVNFKKDFENEKDENKRAKMIQELDQITGHPGFARWFLANG